MKFRQSTTTGAPLLRAPSASVVRHLAMPVPGLNGVLTSAPYFVGDKAQLVVTVSNNAAPGGLCSLYAIFYDDQALTIPLSSKLFLFDQSTSVKDIVPVIGSWVTFQLTALTAGGAGSIFVDAYGVASGVTVQQLTGPDFAFQGVSGPLAVLGVMTGAECGVVVPGRWAVEAEMSGNGLQLHIQQMFTPGVWSRMWFFSQGNTSNIYTEFSVRPAPFRFLITNIGAANQTALFNAVPFPA